MIIDKISIARSQLLTAIELHFCDGDPISVHSLAGAAREILETLCRAKGVKPFSEHIRDTFPHITMNEIWSILNLYRNAFKHADRDDADVIKQFNEISNDFLIYVAVEDYLRLMPASPVPMQVFQAWFCAVHEDRLNDQVDKEVFRKIFPKIRSLPRPNQKRLGRETIVGASQNTDLLSDPKTEPL